MQKHYSRSTLCLSALFICTLLVLLSACSSPFNLPGDANRSDSTPAAHPTARATSQPTPQIQTSCPAANTARAAVMPSMALGTHPIVVYAWNQLSANGQDMAATLRWYDTTNSSKFDIATFQNVNISYAQISTDGQWVLFVVQFSDYSAIQLVRVNGQYLQTLYCQDGKIGSIVHWSPDQKTIIVEKYNVSLTNQSILALDLASGSLQTIVIGVLKLETWFDNSHFIAANILDSTSSKQQTLYMVDITKHDLQVQDLQVIWKAYSNCYSVITTSNPNVLYMSQCALIQNQTGARQPSHIISIPISGTLPSSWPQQIMVDEKTDIAEICPLDQQNILYTLGNLVGSGTDGGLWRINTDGSGKVSQLIVTPDIRPRENVNLNLYSNNSWSNVSRDRTMYAVKIEGETNQSLQIGSVAGGNAKAFAQSDANTYDILQIAGWTTL